MPSSTDSKFARGAYQRSMIATAGPRAIERGLFEKINGELIHASQSAADDYPSFVKALSKNLSLWTLLAADVASNKNKLPFETRASIFKLAAYVRHHTQQLLQSNAENNISMLIELNSTIIAGLKSKQGRAEA
jgi:flagellar protein FlaF